MKRILKTIFVLIGALIGAGFASGQEIYIFFYQYGLNGILGIILSSILIGIVIYKVLYICKKYKINNYKKFLTKLIKNQKQLEILNNIMNLFILITFYIMIAGFGAYFEQEFGITSIIGSIFLSTICYLVFLRDVSGLIKASQYIVPILIGSLLIIGIYSVDITNLKIISNYLSQNNSSKWILDCILYGSYNTILLIPVVITLKNLVENNKEGKIISIITVCIIIILALSVFFILTKVDVNIENLEMPAVYVATNISRIFEYLYGFIILSSIFTTSISLGTSLLENIVTDKTKYKKYSAFMCITSILVSNIGFSQLVNLLYPIFGYIGILQIIKMFSCKER